MHNRNIFPTILETSDSKTKHWNMKHLVKVHFQRWCTGVSCVLTWWKRQGHSREPIFNCFQIYFIFMLAFTYICTPCACPVPQKSKESIKSLGAGIIDRFESPHGCWELNLGPVGSSQCSQPLSHVSSPQSRFLKSMRTHTRLHGLL